MNLDKSNIVGDYIVKKVKKGRLGKHKIVRIPIRGKLKSLLNFNADNGNILEVKNVSNATVNVFLKEIAEVAGIDKHLHFHTARHTFATISLILGMRLEIIKDILGHSDVKMTLRYAHIVDKIRDTEMDKWDTGLKKGGFINDTSQEQVICPRCKNLVLSFRKDIIKLNNIPMECHFCGNEFSFKTNDRKIINMRVV